MDDRISQEVTSQPEDPPGYPSEWSTHIVLRDGATAELRPIRPSDRSALEAFHGRQSKESIYFRFFRHHPELSDKELDYFTHVDYEARMAFVVLVGAELVAVARYEKAQHQPSAEVAFFVDDAHHGRGIATLMLEYLAAAGRAKGIERFTASVLAENYRMLGVFRSAGFDVTSRFADGAIEVDLGIQITADSSSAIADRHLQASVESIRSVLEPSTVAVVGASRQPGSVGYEILANLRGRNADRSDGFAGDVYGINHAVDATSTGDTDGLLPSVAAAAELVSQRANDASGGDRSAAIDLAVLAVPAATVEEAVLACAEAKVRALLVVSAGFSEIDGQGRQRERRLVDLARRNGMRLVGPNAFGLVNSAADVALKALFVRQPVAAGPVALVSQSGPLGIAVLDQLRRGGIGISSFAGVGNRADVSVNDLLDYWEQDAATKAVIMYVENFGNLRRFASTARRVARTTSLLTVAPVDHQRRELLEQSGVMVVDDVAQLAAQAHLSITQPVAKGNRVAVIGNTSSLARLAAEACRQNGLEVIAPESGAGVAREETILIGDLDTVSMLPSSEASDYESVIVAVAVSEEVDAVLIALAPTVYLQAAELEALLERVNRAIDKPIVAVGLVGRGDLRVSNLPYFTFPEQAARALGVHARYGQWKLRASSAPVDTVARQPVKVVADLADEGDRTLTLTDPELPSVLEAIGLHIAPYGVGESVETLVQHAQALGYPVVVKAEVDQRRVGEEGGAAIDLHNEASLRAAYGRMRSLLGPGMDKAVVQQMVRASATVRVELLQDPSIGSVLTVGYGGLQGSGLAPLARCYVPASSHDLDGLVEAVRSSMSDSIDQAGLAAVRSMLEALGEAALATPQLARVVLDPVMVDGAATIAVDVEVTIRPFVFDPLSEVRRL